MKSDIMNNVAIIPARGGSVGVVRKNMRLLAGKPLLWYIINAAKSSKLISKVIVSSDDNEILDYARNMNVDVFCHPKYLSTDSSPSFGVVEWALKEFIKNNNIPNSCVLLRATSPFCTPFDIDAAVDLFNLNKLASSVVSVCKLTGVHPIKLKGIDSNGRLIEKFGSENGIPNRRQNLDEVYMRNAAIYVSKPELILEGKLWDENCYAYIMPEERSLNINTEFEFKIASILMENIQNNKA